MCLVKNSKGKMTVNKSLFENVIHGIPNRPSTPIYKLVQNEYGNQASIDSHNQYLQDSIKKLTENSRKSMNSASPVMKFDKSKLIKRKNNIKGRSNSKL